MSAGLDPASAPPFMGPTPPDAQAMTLGEHYSAILNIIATTTWSDQDMKDTKVFFVAADQLIKQKLQQQQGQLLPEGPAEDAQQSDPNATEDAYTQPGTTPVEMGI